MGAEALATVCFTVPSGNLAQVLSGNGTLQISSVEDLVSHMHQVADVYREMVSEPPSGLTPEQTLRALPRVPSHRLTAPGVDRVQRERILQRYARLGDRDADESVRESRGPSATELALSGRSEKSLGKRPAAEHVMPQEHTEPATAEPGTLDDWKRRDDLLREELGDGYGVLMAAAGAVAQRHLALTPVRDLNAEGKALSQAQLSAVLEIAGTLHERGYLDLGPDQEAEREALRQDASDAFSATLAAWAEQRPDRVRQAGWEHLERTGLTPAGVERHRTGSGPSADRVALLGGAPGTSAGKRTDRGLDLPALVLAAGTPRAGLPDMEPLIAALKDAVDAERDTARTLDPVPDGEWERLPQMLLSNYRHLLSAPVAPGTAYAGNDGVVLRVGQFEVLVTLDATRPTVVRNDAASVDRVVDTAMVGTAAKRVDGNVSAAFNTGAHTDSTGGGISATRLGAKAAMFFPTGTPVAGVRVGGGVSLTRNAVSVETTRTRDVENGRTADARDGAILVALDATWRFKVRHGDTDWPGAYRAVAPSGQESLLLWVNHRYVQAPPSLSELTRRPPVPGSGALPRVHHATGMSHLPQLFDEALHALRQALPKNSHRLLRIGSPTREELRHRIYHLPVNLLPATSEAGYRIDLSDDQGLPVARVVLKTELLTKARQPIGTTSRAPHIEAVSTGISGTSQAQNLSQRTTVSGFADLSFAVPPLSLTGSVAWTQARTDSTSASKTGLSVAVHRWVGDVNTYAQGVSTSVRAYAQGGSDRASFGRTAVLDELLLALPTPEAYRFGYRVVEDHVGGLTAAPAPETGELPVPRRYAEPEGPAMQLGRSLIEVPQESIERLREDVGAILRQRGFLPTVVANPFTLGVSPQQLGALLRNEGQFLKMISQESFAARAGDLFNDGLVMHFKMDRMGGMDEDNVTVLVRAALKGGPRFTHLTRDLMLVHLAMGMSSDGSGIQGRRSLSWGVRAGAWHAALRSAAFGVTWERSAEVANSLTRLKNAATLLEANELLAGEAEVVLEYDLLFSHSGVQGRVRPGIRDLLAQPLGTHTFRVWEIPEPAVPADTRGYHLTRPVPHEVMEDAAILQVVTRGVTAAATAPLRRGLEAVSSSVWQTFVEALTNTNIAAHLPRILRGGMHVFDAQPSLARTSQAVALVRGKLSDPTYMQPLGGTSSNIRLTLDLPSTTLGASTGVTYGRLGAAAGGNAAPHMEVGGVEGALTYGESRSRSTNLAAGREQIPLAFGDHVQYTFRLDLDISFVQNEFAKLLPTGTKTASTPVDGLSLSVVIPENKALEYFLDGVLPFPPPALREVVDRWRSGEKKADSALMARLLVFLRRDTGTAESVGLGEQDLVALAHRLEQKHLDESAPVVDSGVLDAFRQTFPETAPMEPYTYNLPDHLTRTEPGAGFLADSAVLRVTPADGKDLFTRILDLAEQVAPGVLTHVERGEQDSRTLVAGAVPVAVDSLQALFDDPEAFFGHMLTPHGVEKEITYSNGWVAAGVLRVGVRARRVGGPVMRGFEPAAGLEVYNHFQHTVAEQRSASQAYSVTGRHSVEGTAVKGSTALTVGGGRHSATRQSHTVVREETNYAHNGVATFDQDVRVEITVERVDKPGERANTMLNSRHLSSGDPDRKRVDSFLATARIMIPESILHHRPVHEAVHRSPVPVGPLPGNVQLAGVRLEDARHAAVELLGEVFGSASVDPARQVNPVVGAVTSAEVLRAAIHQANGSRFVVANSLQDIARRNRFVTLSLEVELYDLQAIGHIDNAGTGRYDKYLAATSTSSGTTPWQPTVAPGIDGSGSLLPSGTSLASGAAPSRGVSVTGSTGHTRGDRIESHVKEKKQQQALVLTRARIRGRWYAEHQQQQTTGRPKLLGTHRSREFIGELEAYLFADELPALLDRRRRSEEAAQLTGARDEWPEARHAEPIRFSALLEQYTRQPDASVTDPALALSLELNRTVPSRQASDPRVVRIEFDRAEVALLATRGSAVSNHPELFVVPSDLTDITGSVLPVVRDVAVVLRAPVQLSVVEGGRSTREWWFGPTGRLYGTVAGRHGVAPIEAGPNGTLAVKERTADGATARYRDLTVAEVAAAGLLSPGTVHAMELWGVGATALADPYTHSWGRNRTLDAEIREAIDERRRRWFADVGQEMEGLLERVPELLGTEGAGTGLLRGTGKQPATAAADPDTLRTRAVEAVRHLNTAADGAVRAEHRDALADLASGIEALLRPADGLSRLRRPVTGPAAEHTDQVAEPPASLGAEDRSDDALTALARARRWDDAEVRRRTSDASGLVKQAFGYTLEVGQGKTETEYRARLRRVVAAVAAAQADTPGGLGGGEREGEHTTGQQNSVFAALRAVRKALDGAREHAPGSSSTGGFRITKEVETALRGAQELIPYLRPEDLVHLHAHDLGRTTASTAGLPGGGAQLRPVATGTAAPRHVVRADVPTPSTSSGRHQKAGAPAAEAVLGAGQETRARGAEAEREVFLEAPRTPSTAAHEKPDTASAVSADATGPSSAHDADRLLEGSDARQATSNPTTRESQTAHHHAAAQRGGTRNSAVRTVGDVARSRPTGRDDAWSQAPHWRRPLVVEAVRDDRFFDPSEITGLDPQTATELQPLLGDASRQTASRKELAAAITRAARAIGHPTHNTNIVLDVRTGQAAHVTLWLHIAQELASRLDHRISIVLGGNRPEDRLHICP